MINSIQDKVTLNNGVEMPWLGLGVWQSKDGDEVVHAIDAALYSGYRHIDTAAIYKNERGVGEAINSSRVSREEIFLTTKVWNADQGFNNTLRAFDHSLDLLEVEYVDLYLVHWPVEGKYKDTWKAMEKIYSEGRAKAIGVSNFMVEHLEDLLESVEVVPAVNQVEFHPYLLQPELLGFCKDKGIQLEAWSPIMQGDAVNLEAAIKIGEKYGKSPVQVVLRWDLQHGVVTIPKSVNPKRIAANADIFDFELTADEMNALDALDKSHRYGPDPRNFDF